MGACKKLIFAWQIVESNLMRKFTSRILKNQNYVTKETKSSHNRKEQIMLHTVKINEKSNVLFSNFRD